MDKYKLKNMSDELSMQEIESLKDFKGVLGSYKSSIRRKIIYRSLAAVIVAAAAGVIIYLYFLDTPGSSYNYSKTLGNSEVENSINNLVPSLNQPVQSINSVNSGGSKDMVEKVDDTLAAPEKQAFAVIDDEAVFTKAAPSYSLDSVLQVFNIELNQMATTAGSGTIKVAFSISEKGVINSATVIRGYSAEIDSKLLKILEGLPPWKPALLNGVARKSTTTLPITINIEPVKYDGKN
jgi:hypothetical protein